MTRWDDADERDLQRQDRNLRAGHDWQYDDPTDGHVIDHDHPGYAGDGRADDDPAELDRFAVMRDDDRLDDRERRR